MTVTTNIPFSQHLAHLNKGNDDAYATELLRKVTAAVKATGKKGSVSIVLEISAHEGSETMMVIKPKITHTVPTPRRAAAFLYALADGSLVRDDPEQETLDLREVDTSKAEPLELDEDQQA